MSEMPGDAIEMIVPQVPPQDLPHNLNQLALELFLAAVESDASLDPNWRTATLNAIQEGLPGDLSGLEAIVRGEMPV
jgi:hypothetical protein